MRASEFTPKFIRFADGYLVLSNHFANDRSVERNIPKEEVFKVLHKLEMTRGDDLRKMPYILFVVKSPNFGIAISKQKDSKGRTAYVVTTAHPTLSTGEDEDVLYLEEEQLNEFAPSNNPGGGNYLQALASAWYNGTYNTGDLHKGIKSQEDVERILARGIHCGDGKVRKYFIGYNHRFDGVDIQSEDHYEYSDYDDAGNDIDSRTGKPWGPYDVVEFSDDELDESIDEAQLNELSFLGSQCTKDCSGHKAGYEWSARKGNVHAASWSPSFNKGAALRVAGK